MTISNYPVYGMLHAHRGGELSYVAYYSQAGEKDALNGCLTTLVEIPKEMALIMAKRLLIREYGTPGKAADNLADTPMPDQNNVSEQFIPVQRESS